jgi:hypothetical protein
VPFERVRLASIKSLKSREEKMKQQHFGKIWLMVGLFGLLLSVQAQPEKILEDYKPVIELSMDVMAMLELEKTTELTFSPEQAVSLSPVFTELQTKDTMTNDEAVTYKGQFAEQLSAEQLEWITTRSSELFAENFASGGRPSIGMGLGFRLMQGEPVNLVKEGPSKDSLNELAEILEVKAN